MPGQFTRSREVPSPRRKRQYLARRDGRATAGNNDLSSRTEEQAAALEELRRQHGTAYRSGENERRTRSPGGVSLRMPLANGREKAVNWFPMW